MKRQRICVLISLGMMGCLTNVHAVVPECWQRAQDRSGGNRLSDRYDLAMAVDDDGNIYITHPHWKQADSDFEIITKKVTRDGDLVWEVSWDEGDAYHNEAYPGDIPRAIAVDGGIVCVAGQVLNGIEGNDYITFCYDAEDGEDLWTSWPNRARRYDFADQDDEAYAIAMCGGYVYVTGESKDGPTDSDNDVATIKYDASTGSRIWVRRWDENFFDRADYASSIAVDATCGRICVAGGTQVGLLGWQFDWLVACYDPSGNLRWDAREDGGAAVEGCGDYAWDIVVPDSCSPCAVYVTGQLCEGALSGWLNYKTVKYRCSDGYRLADGSYDYGWTDAAYGIAADSSCNIYVTGKSSDGVEYDVATLKYGPGLGDESAVNRYHPGGIGRDITVDDCGWVYITGSGGNGDNDYLTIKYDPADLSREWVATQDNGGEDDAWVIVSHGCEGVFVTGECEGGAGGDLEIVTKRYTASACFLASPPLPDYSPVPPDAGFGTKNRYLTLRGGDAGRSQAARVTFVSLPPPYEYANDRAMWVQEPYLVTEASGSSGDWPPPTFWVAELGCTPYYADWTVYDRVDVLDGGIVPDGVYEVQIIDSTCSPDCPDHYSEPLEVVMSKSGDIVGDFVGGSWTAPNGVINMIDVSACVGKFRNQPTAPRKARCDIVNSTMSDPLPDKKIDFVDISCIVAAFRNVPCLLTGPPLTDPCASAAKAHAGLSSSDAQPAPLGEPVVISLQPSTREIQPGAVVEVEVYAANVVDLHAYELSLTTKGGNADELTVEDLRIDSDRPDYVFASTDAIAAVDNLGNRLGATSMEDGVTAKEQVYLGTFTLRAQPHAKGRFDMQLRFDDGSTFLRDSEFAPIPFRLAGSVPVSIEVGASPGSRPAGRDES